MRCPFCGFDDTQVKDSRPTEDNGAIRRRRFCGNCGQRFTTIERVQLRELTVVKSDGRRVPFDRDKLARSIRISMRKRPIQEERIERIVNSVVRQLEASGDSDIPSKQIGELVMDTLKELDKVAYVRFASVYRNFREAKDFEELAEDRTLAWTRQPLHVTGTLTLNSADPERFLFVLRDARVTKRRDDADQCRSTEPRSVTVLLARSMRASASRRSSGSASCEGSVADLDCVTRKAGLPLA